MTNINYFKKQKIIGESHVNRQQWYLSTRPFRFIGINNGRCINRVPLSNIEWSSTMERACRCGKQISISKNRHQQRCQVRPSLTSRNLYCQINEWLDGQRGRRNGSLPCRSTSFMWNCIINQNDRSHKYRNISQYDWARGSSRDQQNNCQLCNETWIYRSEIVRFRHNSAGSADCLSYGSRPYEKNWRGIAWYWKKTSFGFIKECPRNFFTSKRYFYRDTIVCSGQKREGQGEEKEIINKNAERGHSTLRINFNSNFPIVQQKSQAVSGENRPVWQNAKTDRPVDKNRDTSNRKNNQHLAFNSKSNYQG